MGFHTDDCEIYFTADTFRIFLDVATGVDNRRFKNEMG